MAKTFSLGLLFMAPREDELPGNAMAQICLNNWSSTTYRGKKTPPLITTQCVTARELEFHVRRLHKELDIVLSQAKKKFAAFDKRVEGWRRRRNAE